MSVETDHYLTFLVYLGAIPMTFQRYYIEYSTVSILRLAIPFIFRISKVVGKQEKCTLISQSDYSTLGSCFRVCDGWFIWCCKLRIIIILDSKMSSI